MKRSTIAMGCCAIALFGIHLRAEPKSEVALTMKDRVEQYATVRLTTDLSQLSESEKKVIPLLIEAAQCMDEIFWIESYGDRTDLFEKISDPYMRQFAIINYGPWDRLNGNESFVPGIGPKPPGANFYPKDLTQETLDEYITKHPEQSDSLKNQYTIVRWNNEKNKDTLAAVSYHRFFEAPTRKAAERLSQASAMIFETELKKYLELRAQALLTDDYRRSDMAWMDMKRNTLDIVIGPIETYEDGLAGYKAAHEAYVLVKDQDWSQRLARYAKLLPELQKGLPVDEKFKSEKPGSSADLGAYDVIYYAGDCNAGAKTIAINLPNDEVVQLKKGSRRLQLKNAMRAKFDKILLPISQILIAEDQRKHITFDAFFGNTMFHEVAHGLGIKNTINGKGTVRDALREIHSAMEEGKADILGLYMVTQLRQQGEISEGELMDNYVTFLAGIFRSIRFGAASAHGQANMLRFNYFKEADAFSRDESSNTYRVHLEKMREAVSSLSAKILTLQGNGDYEGARHMLDQYGKAGATLDHDLYRLQSSGIPVDVVFEQGLAVLGLNAPKDPEESSENTRVE